jgi:hypothetical protein
MRALLYFLQSRRVPRHLSGGDVMRFSYAAYRGIAFAAAQYRTGGLNARSAD